MNGLRTVARHAKYHTYPDIKSIARYGRVVGSPTIYKRRIWLPEDTGGVRHLSSVSASATRGDERGGNILVNNNLTNHLYPNKIVSVILPCLCLSNSLPLLIHSINSGVILISRVVLITLILCLLCVLSSII